MKKRRYMLKLFATLLLSSILVLGLTGCGKDNYIKLKGEDFNGSLKLEVK